MCSEVKKPGCWITSVAVPPPWGDRGALHSTKQTWRSCFGAFLVNRSCCVTFPDVTASGCLQELEPQRVFHRLLQLHVTEPQVRFMRRQELVCRLNVQRSVRVPPTHLLTRAQDQELHVRTVRSENDPESEQHGHGCLTRHGTVVIAPVRL